VYNIFRIYQQNYGILYHSLNRSFNSLVVIIVLNAF